MQDMSPSSSGSTEQTTATPPMNPLMSDFADLSLQKKRKVPKGARARHGGHVSHGATTCPMVPCPMGQVQQQQQRQRQRTLAPASTKNRDGSKAEEEGEEGSDESITRISLHQE